MNHNRCGADECGDYSPAPMTFFVDKDAMDWSDIWQTTNRVPTAHLHYRSVPVQRIPLWSEPVIPRYEKEETHQVQSLRPEFGMKVIG